MKILQIVPVFSKTLGGTVAVARSNASELAKRHKVSVYTTSAIYQLSDRSTTPYEIESNGFKIVYFPRNFKRTGLNISLSMASNLLRNHDEFDVIHVHSWRQFQDPLVYTLGSLFKVPYLVQTHGSIPRILSKRSLKFIYDNTLGKKVLQQSKFVLASSKLEAYQYRTLGIPKSKIAIVPNGIDLTMYRNMSENLPKFKNMIGIDEQEKIVLYMGRIHESKGLSLLAKSFAHVVKAYPNSRLVVVGPDDGYKNKFSNLLSQLGISKQVIFTGFISDSEKLAALSESEVLVTPTYNAFPITFLESIFCGCPIITTTNELSWIDNNVGYVSGTSPQDTAKAIIRILSNDDLRESLRDNCSRAIKRFSMEVISAKLEELYMHAIQ